MREFLLPFLSDKRVVEIPRAVWLPLLRGVILPLRCKRVAKTYADIWTDEGSPLTAITHEQAAKVSQRSGTDGPTVFTAMTYGEPSIANSLDAIAGQGFSDITVLPLYPQYSATTTAAVFDQVARWSQQRRDVPALHLLRDYHDHPVYIRALASSVREHELAHGKADVLLMSFHGIPEANVTKGDPYQCMCLTTADLLAAELGLEEGSWRASFQSRFGRAEWVKPYTTDVLEEFAHAGKSVAIISPAFAADCLETLYEVSVELREEFEAISDRDYSYIPCLNARDDHIDLFAELLQLPE